MSRMCDPNASGFQEWLQPDWGAESVRTASTGERWDKLWSDNDYASGFHIDRPEEGAFAAKKIGEICHHKQLWKQSRFQEFSVEKTTDAPDNSHELLEARKWILK